MIFTVTPNPLFDFVLRLESSRFGVGTRMPRLPWTVGGKGINVARLLKTLGRPAVALSFAGGPFGAKIGEGLRQQGIPHRLVATEAETRAGINLVGLPEGAQTWFIEEGDDLAETEVGAMIDLVRTECRSGDLLVMSGTVPGHAHRDLYGRLLEVASALALRTFIDATGAPLRAAAGRGRFILKHNREETLATYGADPFDPTRRSAWVDTVRGAGVSEALVTDGGRPACWWDGQRFTWLIPPPVPVVSAIGCGDAAMAGMIYAIETGATPLDACRWAMAAGAADASRAGPCEADYREIAALLPRIEVRPDTP